MNKNLKIILISLTSLFVLGLGGVGYFVSTKINSKEIHKQVLSALKKSFPKSKIELGKIDVGFGTSIGLKLKKLKITLPKNGKSVPLLEVGDLQVQVPIFAILLGGGNIDIFIESPAVSYIEFGKKNNWELAAKENETAINKKKDSDNIEEGHSSDIVLPAFLAQSRLNLKVRRLKLNYKLKDKSSGKVNLSRFIIKDLNFKEATAFELDSDFQVSLASKKNVSLSTLVLGEFNLAEILETKKIKTRMTIKVSKVDLEDSGLKIPEIKSKVNLEIGEKGDVTGSLDTEFLSNSLSLLFSTGKGAVSVKNLKSDLLLSEIFNIVGLKNKDIEIGKSKFKLNGGVNILKSGAIVPKLEFSISPKFTFRAGKHETSSELTGSYRGIDVFLSTDTDLLKGSILTEFKGKFDLAKPEIKLESMPPFKLKITAENIELPKEMLVSEEKKSEPKKAQTVGSNNKEKAPLVPLLPSGSIKLNWNKIKVAGNDLSGSGSFKIRKREIKTKDFKFLYSDGRGSLRLNSKIYQDKIKNKFTFKLKNFDLKGISPFMPKGFGETSGVCTGSAKGTADLVGENVVYKIPTTWDCQRGSISGFDITPMIASTTKLLESITKNKNKKKVQKLSDKYTNFEKLNFSGIASSRSIIIKKFGFTGLKKMITVKRGRGTIFPSEKKTSTVFLDLFQKSYHKGKNKIPLKLRGPGYTLKPDYNYTLKYIAKAEGKKALKKAKKKAKKKLKAKAKKEINKLLKGKAGKKVNDLINGFFQ